MIRPPSTFRRWEVRSAGKGSKGERWYAWALVATASSRHHLLIRRQLTTGELAFHYCFVPEGQPVSKARLIRAAGLRWPVGKDCFGLDQSQARARWYHQRTRLTRDSFSVGLFRDLAGEEIPPLISSVSWRTLATPGLVLALSRVRR